MLGLLGADRASGALAIGDAVCVRQTLRFFVRDAASADADLRRAERDKVVSLMTYAAETEACICLQLLSGFPDRF